ncbi:phage tail protein [Streptomyces sp. NBC_01387]|uniref:phage tail protein n=1 Tax=unclassified Streptomyces TaxID=2593676 RepID=UPI0020251CA9|nr:MULTISPECIES: phage tail protein [unclassified Streptomyces]MCX4549383.1 phage tail protein [Streptomyces sp. NBC_01500]WSC20920.1 phage tail protein [Streptomyces sp. NBC_01766]WSV54926.1 phage tail protein [Streptomyces sp. NBC_01014]
MTSDLDPGSSLFFTLTIDGEDLGSFNGCEGLSSEVEMEHYQEGGNNGFVWNLPTRVTFSTIRLTRPLTAETTAVAAWISSVTTGISRPTAEIAALRADGSLVARWGLLDVVPVRWQGPTLDPANPAVAVEVLEIAHHGFTDVEAE